MVNGEICMKNLIEKLMDKARRFSIFDYAIFKITLFSAGVLLGTYFSSFFLSNIGLVWIVFAVSYGYMFYISFVRG